jgi:hypothetical protein
MTDSKEPTPCPLCGSTENVHTHAGEMPLTTRKLYSTTGELSKNGSKLDSSTPSESAGNPTQAMIKGHQDAVKKFRGTDACTS